MSTALLPTRRSSSPSLAGNYPSAKALALVASSPLTVLSTAQQPIAEQVMRDLHTTTFGLRLADGLAHAGYVFGAVATGRHYPAVT
jgi:hypothetical protein